MPFYEYKCSNCGHQEEVLQKIGDKPLKKCAECGKSTMKKMVSAAAFRLKGGGWYETDFKSGDKKNVADDSKGSTKGEAKADTTSDTKAGAKNKEKVSGSKNATSSKKSSGSTTKAKKVKS